MSSFQRVVSLIPSPLCHLIAALTTPINTPASSLFSAFAPLVPFRDRHGFSVHSHGAALTMHICTSPACVWDVASRRRCPFMTPLFMLSPWLVVFLFHFI